MEHPPKQGLKQIIMQQFGFSDAVLMEHPPKQGLKRKLIGFGGSTWKAF